MTEDTNKHDEKLEPGIPEAVVPMRIFHDPSTSEETADLYKNIWGLALPVFIGQGINSMVGFISRIIIGQMGEKAFNSVNIGMMVFFLIITVVAAVGVGTTALVAQSWGMGNKRRAGEIMQQSIIYGVLLSVLIMIFGIALRKSLFIMLGTDPDTAEMGSRFLLCMFIGVPFLTPGFFFASGLRGAGDTRTPMIAGVIMAVISLVLSYGLILGGLGMPRLGVLGAALATVLSFLIFTLILGWLIFTNRTILKLPLTGWKPDNRLGISIFKIGIPSATEWILIQLGILIYVSVITDYGEAALSGYFAGLAVLSLAQTVTFGFQTASTTLVGQSIGAGDYLKAENVFRRSILLSFIFMGGIGALTAIGATSNILSAAFGELSPESIGYTRDYILLLVLLMPLMGVSFTIAGGLRGAGDTVWPLIGSSVGVYGGRILFALLIYKIYHPHVILIWCTMFPDLLIRIGIMTFRLRSGKWKALRLMAS